MYILFLASQVKVDTKPMLSNAHQIHPRQEARNAQQNPYGQDDDKSPFLSLLSIIYDSQRLTMHPSPPISILIRISEAKPTEPQKMLKFRCSRLGVDRYLQNGFRTFRSPFLAKVRLRRLFNTERSFCIVVFRTFGAAGLHACHVLTVVGSPLPAAICIERWVDQVNLQAELKISGKRVLSYLTGHEFLFQQPRILSSQPNRLADATFSKSCEA